MPIRHRSSNPRSKHVCARGGGERSRAMQQLKFTDPPGRSFPPPAPAPMMRRAHHCCARSEVAFRLVDDLNLGGGGGNGSAGFDEIGSEDDLFSTFMDIKKIPSAPTTAGFFKMLQVFT